MVHACANGNLPAEVTTFVGRRHELAQVRSALQTSRLVTLAGPGGVGKTRLAVQAAASLRQGFPAGAWVVELAPLRDPALVGQAVAASLGLRDQAGAAPVDMVVRRLGDTRALLVLDNCEHLVSATAQLVAELLGAAPGLRVLATSREPLAIAGEQVLPVGPLPLPSSHDPLARLRQNDAVALFVERAAAASGTFELTETNGAAVVDVCRRLDGIPLAIELAAVRTRALSPAQILDRLDNRFALLTEGNRAALPRQRTLRAAFDWSHDLLDPAERRLFASLSVFAGRFTLEDVEAVCGEPGPRQDGTALVLAALVDRSLVVKDEIGGVPCYRQHESVREYARLWLVESGTQAQADERFTAHYLARCGRFAVEARYRLLEWMPWVELEMDNIRAVLRRTLDGQGGQGGQGGPGGPGVAVGLDLAAFLVWYWVTRATTEGVRWLDELLAPGSEPAAHPWALFVRGFLAVQQGDPTTAVPVLARGIDAARAVRDLPALAQTLAMASIAATLAGDHASSDRLLREAGQVAADLDDLGATLMTLQARAQTGLAEGDLGTARSAAAKGVLLSRAAGDLYSLGMMLLNEGFVALLQGEAREAEHRFVDGLELARRLDDRVAQCYLVGGLGACAAASGEHRRAALLLGAMEALQAEVGGTTHAAMAPALTTAASVAQDALGGARYAAERDAGRRLGRDAVLGLASREDPATTADVLATPLSRRETEVARLVADGLTNKEIGAALFVSERTVESHVRSILNTLGFRSRAQIARWVI